MKSNLDSLRREIADYLETQGMAVFYGFAGDSHESQQVLWDVEKEPDYRRFIHCAQQVGAHMMIFDYRDFSEQMVDDALERLEKANFSRDEKRAIERRLNELRVFDGFTCSLELSFEHHARYYTFDLRTDWYDELLDIVERIEDAIAEDLDESDEEPMGGYFSKN